MCDLVRTCVVWVRLPTRWTKRCRHPEAMRRRFGPCTPQPLKATADPGTLYLFCVAMRAERAAEIIESAGACICCQPAEDIAFDVTRYTPQHRIHPTGRETASGEEEFELVRIH
jgi:hypothetical protein